MIQCQSTSIGISVNSISTLDQSPQLANLGTPHGQFDVHAVHAGLQLQEGVLVNRSFFLAYFVFVCLHETTWSEGVRRYINADFRRVSLMVDTKWVDRPKATNQSVHWAVGTNRGIIPGSLVNGHLSMSQLWYYFGLHSEGWQEW